MEVESCVTVRQRSRLSLQSAERNPIRTRWPARQDIMNPKHVKLLVGGLSAAVLVAVGRASVLDFETVNGLVPMEGMSISNQFQAQFGISFRRADGGYPVIGRTGVPRASFVVVTPELDLYDTLHPDDPRANQFGDFFLTDDGVVGGTKQIIVDFAAPVAKASGYLLDIDNSERMRITAYSDDGVTEVGEIVLAAGDVETGNGRSTPWSFERPTADIRQIRFKETGASSNANVAFDDFDSSYVPPPQQPAALDVRMAAVLSITGDVGRPYRIEYAEHLTPTKWVGLTNLVLPSSPFLFVDLTSTNATQRFFRVVSLP